MAKRYKYYFQVNSKGDPLPQTNIKSLKKPKGLGRLRWKEFVPQSRACCSTPEEPETSEGRKWKYYVRLDDNQNPISGTLIKARIKPKGFDFQEVVGIYCCDFAPTIDNVIIDTFDWDWDGNILTLGNASDPQGSTVTLWTTGTIGQDDMEMSIEDTQDGTVNIAQDAPTVNTTNTSVFTVVATDGHGHQTTFTVTVNYENLPPTLPDATLDYNMIGSPEGINILTLANPTDPEAQTVTMVQSGLVAGDNGDITLNITNSDGTATVTSVGGPGSVTVFNLSLTDGINVVPFTLTITDPV